MEHVHVRFYFATDKIRSKGLKIIHCPADELVAGYNSKPLQGKLPCRHRNAIMGICEEDFAEHKGVHVAVLKQHDLYEDEDDLMGL